MIPFFQLVRWQNLLLLLFTQLTVAYCLSWRLQLLAATTPVAPDLQIFYLLVVPTLLITAAGYIINDYFDLEIDKINKPNKVYIERKIPPNWAMAIYLSLNTMAIGIAVYYWRLDLLVAYLAIITLLFFYSSLFKKMPLIGNIVVAFMAASAVGIFFYEDRFLLDFQSKNANGLQWIYLGYLIFAFLSTLIREIIKDIQDIRGDAALGANTYPILAGIHQSKHLISGLFILLLALEILLLLLLNQQVSSIPWILLIIYIMSFFVPACFIFVQTWVSSDSVHFSRLSHYMKIYMLVALIFLWLLPFYF